MNAAALTEAQKAERIARTTEMRVVRLLPKAQEFLDRRCCEAPGHVVTYLVTANDLAAIIDEVQQDMRRQHNEDMRQAERDSRDAYSEGRHDGAQQERDPFGMGY